MTAEKTEEAAQTKTPENDEDAKLKAQVERKLKKQKIEKDLKAQQKQQNEDFTSGIQNALDESKLFKVSTSSSIFFKDVHLLSPALDCNPNHILMITAPLPGIRREEIRGEIVKTADMILCVVTSDYQIFEANNAEFMRRGWLAAIPNPIIQPRWSAASIEQFTKGESAIVSISEIYKSVKGRFDHFMDFSGTPFATEFCAVYTIATYFYILFEYFAYLKLGGEKGSAKSKLGAIFTALAFNGKLFANATAPAIYRSAQDMRCCMVIDETEDLAAKDEEKAAYSQVLLSGFNRQGSALRIDKDSMRPVNYSTYCPKVLCSIGGLYEVLEDRSLEIILLKTLNREKSGREVVESDPTWQPIRDSLYLLLMQNWKTVKGLTESVTSDLILPVTSTRKNPEQLFLPSRLWNISKPFVVIARFIDSFDSALNVEDAVKEFLFSQMKKKEETASETLAASVLLSLEKLVKHDAQTNETYQVRVLVKDVLENVRELEGDSAKNREGQYWIKTHHITKILGNLQLYNERKRIGKGWTFLCTIGAVKEAKLRLNISSTELDDQPSGKLQVEGPPSGFTLDDNIWTCNYGDAASKPDQKWAEEHLKEKHAGIPK